MKKLVKKPTPKKRQPMPPGWTRQQIQELAAYYDNQSEDEQFAEHETARKTAGQTMLDVPTELHYQYPRVYQEQDGYSPKAQSVRLKWRDAVPAAKAQGASPGSRGTATPATARHQKFLERHRRMKACTWFALGLTICVFVGSSEAAFRQDLPLKKMMSDSQYVILAKVARIAPETPGLTLTFDEDLKGKLSFRQLNVNLNGDDKAKKQEQTPKLLKRLAAGLPVVLFIRNLKSTDGDRFACFAYSNGTWFSLGGTGRPKARPPRCGS